jgi:hypothetical protein
MVNMPFGKWKNFEDCVQDFVAQGKDEESAKRICGALKARLETDGSHIYGLEGEVGPKQGNLIHGSAIHPIKTFHPEEWPGVRVYLEDELKKAASTLAGAPLLLDHTRPLDGHVLEACMHAMDGERAPEVEGAIRFQKAFGDVNPEDFGASQFQIYFLNSEKYPPDWGPPVEGTYRVCWGNLPSTAKEMDDSTYLRHAKQSLLGVEDSQKKLVERFVDKPNSRVPAVVRLQGATVKSYVYDISMLLTMKPKVVLRLRLDELISIVEEGIKSKGCFSGFFEQISNWSRIQQDFEYARNVFREGAKALDEVACWFADYQKRIIG